MAQRLVRTLAAAALALLVAFAGSASAGTKTVQDEKGPDPQGPANSLVRGTLTYTEKRAVFKAKVKTLNMELTRVYATVSYPDHTMLRLRAFYRHGKDKVTDATYYGADSTQVYRRGVVSRWDYKRDVVTVVFNNERNDPKPWNKQAHLHIFTVMKGPCTVRTAPLMRTSTCCPATTTG